MREMSWIRSSNTAGVVVLLAIALLATGTVAAIQFDGAAPESAEVGEEVNMSIEITEPFADPLPSQWTLEGDTELNSADWTIVAEDNTGDIVSRSDTNELQLNADDSIVAVTVEIRGEVPDGISYNYENPDEENYTAVELLRQTDSGAERVADEAIWEAHRFTAESQEARTAIDEAAQSVEEANSGEDELDSAISAYNNANFELAIDLADEAESTAEGSEQTTQFLLLGGAVVVLTAVVGGGFYVYRQRQRDTNKLR
jgi:exonuclease VII small subunit